MSVSDNPTWEWDGSKDEANYRAHGFRFQLAALVFEDPLAATMEDPNSLETRWRTMGVVAGVVLVVVHTWPEYDSVIGTDVGRIISARKATRRERAEYETGS